MAFYNITGNALDFQALMTCLQVSPGTPGQNHAKAEVHDRLLEVWPEFNMKLDKPRIDDKSAEALKTRTMRLDTEEQGALAECFLAAVKADTTAGARFFLFRDAAKLIQVSGWWIRQVKSRLPPFAEGDNPQSYSDAQPAQEAAKATP